MLTDEQRKFITDPHLWDNLCESLGKVPEGESWWSSSEALGVRITVTLLGEEDDNDLRPTDH